MAHRSRRDADSLDFHERQWFVQTRVAFLGILGFGIVILLLPPLLLLGSASVSSVPIVVFSLLMLSWLLFFLGVLVAGHITLVVDDGIRQRPIWPLDQIFPGRSIDVARVSSVEPVPDHTDSITVEGQEYDVPAGSGVLIDGSGSLPAFVAVTELDLGQVLRRPTPSSLRDVLVTGPPGFIPTDDPEALADVIEAKAIPETSDDSSADDFGLSVGASDTYVIETLDGTVLKITVAPIQNAANPPSHGDGSVAGRLRELLEDVEEEQVLTAADRAVTFADRYGLWIDAVDYIDDEDARAVGTEDSQRTALDSIR
jgi:hypothetical protein